ncbi:hypothetical protein GCM10020367_24260 [Streptomyces sannanensis]|uniref:NlpC/P60 domain-containing protein n=2 Tax=Streptomyces sannanensis TaxID=285536 RepID=A0ABP6SA80_9ACTN
MPVFEEFEPLIDCGCPGCVQRRRERGHTLPPRAGGHPAARGARRALVLVTAAGMALAGGGGSIAAAHAPAGRSHPGPPQPARANPQSDTPQGRASALHGGRQGNPGPPLGPAALPRTTRADIINRAKKWVEASVPYSMSGYWTDGYRQDCSGFVSMAWGLGANQWTGSLARFATPLRLEELQPGDMLLFHNPANPMNGSHVVIFGGWTDYRKTSYIAYEQTRPHTRKQVTPYAYWTNSARYVPYRYKGLITGGAAGPANTPAFPGITYFGPGAENVHITQLGQMLIERGAEKYYGEGPGPHWGDADRLATQAFQRAQGWSGADANGLPGPRTWKLLVSGVGKNIPGAGPASGPASGSLEASGPASGSLEASGPASGSLEASGPASGSLEASGPASGSLEASGPASGSAPDPASGGATAMAAPTEPTGPTDFPGRGYFRPGQSNAYVEKLGRQLRKKGFGSHYTSGPAPRWHEADRRNVEAFQRAQGWSGADANGYPGPETWRRLFE